YHGKDSLFDTLQIGFEPPLPGVAPIAVPVRLDREEGQRLVAFALTVPAEMAEGGLYTMTGTLTGAAVSGSAPLRIAAITLPESPVRIGLIESYDTTLRTTLRQLGIPFDLLEDADLSPDALS